ncbi:MAG: redoxin family protein [Xanthomonadaceae bacterium]|nr:redoxin family protein [Xanthomonadaceae bacterium]
MTESPLAPDLPPALDWVNAAPLRISALRGRLAALVFWHTGSATSANALADIGYLQTKYADGLSVIGIHTPKFDAQRELDLVARAVNRLGVRFPVASDPDAVAWQHYGIRAWPSVALVDAFGRLVDIIAGDRQREVLEQRIVELLDDAGERGVRVYENAQPALRPEPMRELCFPTALALTPQRLYVCDSGHHRVMECSHEGQVLRVFGSGSAGFEDGPGIQASFQSPGGLVVLKDALYVSDVGNHAIRRIQLGTGQVDTLLGQGSPGTPQAVANFRESPVLLDRPCGLAANFDRLYIAMAGANQVWEADLTRFGFRTLAGSGRLALADGTGALAAFAQPMGLAVLQHTLYVADGQASALRSLHLGSGMVQTLIGLGLFDFGQASGKRPTARLQYPVGIALDPKSPVLWVADCYNDAIAMLRLGAGELTHLPVDYPLRRPTAVVSDGARLWVSNTDAHEVLRVDLASREAVVLPMTA